jgi:ABC-2 type transport system permease protein
MSRFLAEHRAFWASALREWRTLRRYRGATAGALFWPVLGPAVYVAQAYGFAGGDPRAMEAFTARAGTGEIAGFIYVGWSAYVWLSIVLWGPGTALRTEQVRGSLEAVFLTPSSRLVVIFGPAAAHLVSALFMYVVVGVALTLGFGVTIEPARALRALAVIAIAVPALYGLGALFAAAVLRLGEVGGTVQLVRGVFTVFCGMTFPIVVLPEWARAVALTLPPTYLIADVRAVLLAGADLVDLGPDLLVLLALGLLLCLLAVLVFGWTERYARRGGTLAQY